MDHSLNTKVLEISLKFNMNDGLQLKLLKKRSYNNFYPKIKEFFLLIIGLVLFKVGVFLLMSYLKSAKSLYQIIYMHK